MLWSLGGGRSQRWNKLENNIKHNKHDQTDITQPNQAGFKIFGDMGNTAILVRVLDQKEELWGLKKCFGLI